MAARKTSTKSTRTSPAAQGNGFLPLLPTNHPLHQRANGVIPTDHKVYGNDKIAQYAVGCQIGDAAARVYLDAAGTRRLGPGRGLQGPVLDAIELLPQSVARGFVVGFLSSVEDRIFPSPNLRQVALERSIDCLIREVDNRHAVKELLDRDRAEVAHG